MNTFVKYHKDEFLDNCLEQWFSNLWHYKHLEASLKFRLLGLTPKSFDEVGLR